MTVLRNDASLSGQASGTAVTTGNSGGGANTAFGALTGTWTFDSSHPASLATMGWHGAATSGAICRLQMNIASATATNAVRVYDYLTGTVAPSTTQEWVQLGSTGQNYIGVNTGAHPIVTLQGSIAYTSTYTLLTATQYRIEAWWTIAASNAQFHYALYIGDSTTKVDSFDTTTANTGTTNPTQIQFGKVGTTGNWTDHYMSLFAVDTAASGFIGVPANVAPTANAGPDQAGVATSTTVTLDGSGSSDTDGTIASYAWTQTAGTTVTLSSTTAQKPTFTAPSTAQTLTFSLTVTDNLGATSTADTVDVAVVVAGPGPVLASYLCDGTPGTAVTTGKTGFASITGSMVFDSTGTAIEVADGAQAFCQDQTAGDYCAIWLSVPALPTVTDECVAQALNGATSLASVRMRTTGAISIYSSLSTLVGTTTATITPGTRYRLEWNTRSDGQELRLYTVHGSTPIETITGAVASALATTQRRFGHPQASEAAGVVDIYQATINSGWPNATNTVPVAVAGPDQTNVAAGAIVTLDGTGSSDQNADPITYAWMQTAGDPVTLSSTSASKPTFTAPSTAAAQTLGFSLLVSDNQGATSSPDSVTVGVLAVAGINLKIRLGGSFVPALEYVRINGIWLTVDSLVIIGITGTDDGTVYGNTYANTY